MAGGGEGPDGPVAAVVPPQSPESVVSAAQRHCMSLMLVPLITPDAVEPLQSTELVSLNLHKGSKPHRRPVLAGIGAPGNGPANQTAPSDSTAPSWIVVFCCFFRIPDQAHRSILYQSTDTKIKVPKVV